jgi:hypothetical protein
MPIVNLLHILNNTILFNNKAFPLKALLWIINNKITCGFQHQNNDNKHPFQIVTLN